MRTIKLGGHEYPIQGSITVHKAAAKRRNDMLRQADAEAEAEQAEKLKAGEIADINELIIKKRAAALSDEAYNAGEALQLFSDLINAAVEYSAYLLGKDIADTIFGGYPMTAEKLAFLAGVDDLNNNETNEAVAYELLESQGGAAAKNLTAQDVVKLTRQTLARAKTLQTGQ